MDNESPRKRKINGRTQCCETVPIVAVIAGFIGLGLCVVGVGMAKMVLGILYLHECELQPLLPVYLIVDCSVGLLLFVCILIISYGSRGDNAQAAVNKTETATDNTENSDGCFGPVVSTRIFQLGVIALLFLFSWFIVGTVWVVNLKETISEPGHCQNTTFPKPITGINFAPTESSSNTTFVSTSLSTYSYVTPDQNRVPTPGDSVHCVTCSEVLVNFTFVVVIVQWALFGIAVATVIGILIVFGTIVCLCSAIN